MKGLLLTALGHHAALVLHVRWSLWIWPVHAPHQRVAITYDLENTLAGDTLDAHRLLHLARAEGKQKALIERFHRGYFSEHANLFDRDALLRLAVEAGLDEPTVADVLDGDRFTSDVEADQAEAHARGIRSVPHFLIDDCVSVSGGQPLIDCRGLRRHRKRLAF